MQAIIKPPLFLPTSINVMDALHKMQKQKNPMALVIDQYGVCCGIVTPEDVAMMIVAETEEQDSLKGGIRKYKDFWVADGLSSVHSIMEVFSFTNLPGDDPDSYNTLGGLLMSVLDKIPQQGDVFEWENLRFEILFMDGQRVSRVKISQTTQ
jgi:putative hemolysin